MYISRGFRLDQSAIVLLGVSRKSLMRPAKRTKGCYCSAKVGPSSLHGRGGSDTKKYRSTVLFTLYRNAYGVQENSSPFFDIILDDLRFSCSSVYVIGLGFPLGWYNRPFRGWPGTWAVATYCASRKMGPRHPSQATSCLFRLIPASYW